MTSMRDTETSCSPGVAETSIEVNTNATTPEKTILIGISF